MQCTRCLPDLGRLREISDLALLRRCWQSIGLAGSCSLLVTLRSGWRRDWRHSRHYAEPVIRCIAAEAIDIHSTCSAARWRWRLRGHNFVRSMFVSGQRPAGTARTGLQIVKKTIVEGAEVEALGLLVHPRYKQVLFFSCCLSEMTLAASVIGRSP